MKCVQKFQRESRDGLPKILITFIIIIPISWKSGTVLSQPASHQQRGVQVRLHSATRITLTRTISAEPLFGLIILLPV